MPGPVFVECPVDLLYDESMVRKLYGTGRGGKSIGQKAVNAYLTLHVNRMFAGAEKQHAGPMLQIEPLTPDADKVAAVAERLKRAQRPVLIVGSQTTLDVAHVAEVAAALERIGAPVYLSGMARGLLGRDHPLQLRHKRREALKEADLVLLAGVPADFRLDYGNHIRRSAFYVSANRSAEDLNQEPQTRHRRFGRSGAVPAADLPANSSKATVGRPGSASSAHAMRHATTKSPARRWIRSPTNGQGQALPLHRSPASTRCICCASSTEKSARRPSSWPTAAILWPRPRTRFNRPAR